MGLKANEVRKGNIFYSTGRGYVTLKDVSTDGHGNGLYVFSGNDNVEGRVTAVVLTKENIVYFGFTEIENNLFQTSNPDVTLEWIESPPIFLELNTRTELRELHQLQNLYHDITGQELKLQIDLDSFNEPPFERL